MVCRRKRKSNCNLLPCSLVGSSSRSRLWSLVSTTHFEKSIQTNIKALYFRIAERSTWRWVVCLWAWFSLKTFLNFRSSGQQVLSMPSSNSLDYSSYKNVRSHSHASIIYLTGAYYISFRAVPPWEKGTKNQKNHWSRKGTIQIRKDRLRYQWWQIVNYFFFFSYFSP